MRKIYLAAFILGVALGSSIEIYSQTSCRRANLRLAVKYDPPKTDASEGFVINKLYC